jgi:hypothetical protein
MRQVRDEGAAPNGAESDESITEGRAPLKLWHALRRETAGAWRSVRYDLDVQRAAKLAGAFTEELRPAGSARGAAGGPSRLVPLAGVALLLVGGAAGAVLAIGGGLSALGADNPLPFPGRPGLAGPDGPGTAPQPGMTGAGRPLTPHRPGSRTSPAPGQPAAPAAGPALPEASSLPVSPAPTGGSADPTPSDPGPSSEPPPASPSPSTTPSSGSSDEKGDGPSDGPHNPPGHGNEHHGGTGGGHGNEYDRSGGPTAGR